MLPFERQAGNDLFRVRKNYPDFIIMGSFNKAILRDANSKWKEELDKELEEISILIKSGGYIPFRDHFILPDVSWERFSSYRQKLNVIIEDTKVL